MRRSVPAPDSTEASPLRRQSGATYAAVYVRVSTGRQAEEGYSLDEQERRGVAHIERLGWVHVGTYREEGVSGAKKHRRELDRLLADLERIDAVVVPSLDRLGRSTKDLLELYDAFEAAGVALVSLREQIDTTSPVGRLLRTVLSAVAELERDLGIERTSSAIGARARVEAKPWGPEPAYGYAKGADGHWQPEPHERLVVERIFRERVEPARSYNAIAQGLNRDRVPPRRGRHWSARVIQRILTGRDVLGYFRHGDEWIRGRHAPLVEEDTWLAAQVAAEAGRKYAPGGSGRLPKRHLFVRGMLRCGVCGAAMLPRSAADSRDVYVCRTRKQTGGASACPMPPLPRTAVDYAALSLFRHWALSVEGTRRKVAEAADARLAEVEAQAALAERQVADLLAQRDRVERDYLAGTLGAASYERLVDRLAGDLEGAVAERERLAAHEESVREAAAALVSEEAVLRRVHDVHVALTARMREAEATSDALSNVGPLRAALAQVFERVVVRWPTPQDFDDPTVFEVPGVAGWPFLEPILRRDVFDAGAETRADQWSTVRRVALDLGVEPAALEPGAGGVGGDDNNQTGSGVPL